MEGALKQEEDTHERVIQTMKWGLVPSWHKGEPGTFPALLNNCRSDGMLEKASFRTAIQRGQRCVVLADGSVSFWEGREGREGKGRGRGEKEVEGGGEGGGLAQFCSS